MANTESNRAQPRNLSSLEEKQKVIDREPFRHLKITDPAILDTVEGREICGQCYKSRKFFCYTCCVPVIDEKYVPRVKLPIKIDIIKHAREIDGKSTAIHAALLAPEDVRIFTYPDFPESFEKETVLIFPSKSAVTVDLLFSRDNKIREADDSIIESFRNVFPIKRAVFIDSTWHQTKAIYKDQRLRDLPCVVLRSRISQFWRHQKKSPRWYLATIEAIHQFLVEMHTCAFGAVEGYADNDTISCDIDKKEQLHEDVANSDLNALSELYQRYNGQYDNLLYFFKYMYQKIHTIYDHDKLWAYKRPLI